MHASSRIIERLILLIDYFIALLFFFLYAGRSPSVAPPHYLIREDNFSLEIESGKTRIVNFLPESYSPIS